MGAVFVSYRRGDSEGQARALSVELTDMLGKSSVFMDVDSLALGRDFRESLQTNLASCDCFLALIGPHWLDVKDDSGKRRLDSPTDYVRQEISAALKRGIPVTPVLLQGARIPAADDLPEDIRDLAYRNGFELSHLRWESDVAEMVRRLGLGPRPEPEHQPQARPASAYKWLLGGGALVAGVLWLLFSGSPAFESSDAAAKGSTPDKPSEIQAATESTPTPKPELPRTERPRREEARPVRTDALSFGIDQCKSGFVWRDASATDHVCVTPEARSNAAEQNGLAASRRNPNGGPYGPDTCVNGFVWRAAFAKDLVCVTPAERAAAAEDNQAGPARALSQN
jgi:hypothetical protein